jgi:hemolysin activation/secretion protein
MMRWRTLALAGCALAVTATAAEAQTPPAQADPSAVGAGLIRRGEGLATPRVGSDEPAEIEGVPAPSQPAQTSAGQVSFRLQAVRFGESRFLKPGELEALAAPLIGTEVSFADLGRLLDRINARFAAAGAVTARAILPPQQIEGGVVRIDIVEGRVGRQSVVSPGYTPAAYVEPRVGLPPGEVVDLAQLRRRISGFNRTNDAQLRAELQAGASTGLTDINVTVVDPARTGLQVFVDNNAYASTGRLQAGLSLRRNQVLAPGDRATLYAAASEGSLTGVGAYSAPVGRLLRASFSYAHSDIEVVDGPFAELDVKGRSDTAVASLARPVLIGETYGVSAQGAYTVIRSVNEVAGETVGDVALGKLTLGLNGFAEGRAGLLRFDYNLSYAGVDHRVGTGADHFAQTAATLEYTSAPIAAELVVRAALSAQYADHRDLPGSQVFQLGGVASVRGYEPGALSGHAGYVGSVELHRGFTLGDRRTLDAYVFSDAGQVFFEADERLIGSVGLGLNVALTERLLLQGVYGYGYERAGAEAPGDRLELRLAYTFS